MIFEEFFQSESIPTAVKWLVTILFTGFIAQFGKRLADYLLKKFKRKGQDPNHHIIGIPEETLVKPGLSESVEPSRKLIKTEQKLGKKQAKASIKQKKKSVK